MGVVQRSFGMVWGGRCPALSSTIQNLVAQTQLHSRCPSPELAPPLGDLGHVEQARLFHLLRSGARGINKAPGAPPPTPAATPLGGGVPGARSFIVGGGGGRLGKRGYPANTQKEEDVSRGAGIGGRAVRILAFAREWDTYMGVVQHLRQSSRGL